MSQYKSRPVSVARSAESLFAQFSDLSSFRDKLDTMPEDIRKQAGDIEFTTDSIILSNPQVGQLEFAVREMVPPRRIVLKERRMPIPLEMSLDIAPVDAENCTISAAIDIDLPMMIRPLVGPKLQKAVDTFGEMLAGLNR